MAQQYWVNLVNGGDPWQVAQGTALSASASTATISPQAAGSQDFVLPTLPDSSLQWHKALKYKIEASGTIGSGGTGSNLTVFLACGVSGTLATTLASTAAIALGTGSLSGLEWYLLATVKCIAIGSTGNTLAAEGHLHIQTSTAALAVGTANDTVAPLPYTATAFNTYTASTALGLRATLSAAFGSIQCNSFDIYQTN
jgi:hypothetical protein